MKTWSQKKAVIVHGPKTIQNPIQTIQTNSKSKVQLEATQQEAPIKSSNTLQ